MTSLLFTQQFFSEQLWGFLVFSQCHTSILFMCHVHLLTLFLLLLFLIPYLKNIKNAFDPLVLIPLRVFVKFLFDNYANLWYFLQVSISLYERQLLHYCFTENANCRS